MVSSTAGPEQEYFLIDRNFYYARPDLLTSPAARCSAHAPPKGQEFDDHYFGAIPDRVLACMLRLPNASYVQARHPGQDASQRGGAGPV